MLSLVLIIDLPVIMQDMAAIDEVTKYLLQHSITFGRHDC
jgi:hypothetical protein